MPYTPYKGYSVPTTGTEPGTWGNDLNTNTFAVIDLNLGGIVTKTLSNVNVTLSVTESQNLILRLIGTITANIQITTSCQGFTLVENATTGAFTVSMSNGVGSPVIVGQGGRSIIIADAVNGCRKMASDSFDTGTILLSGATAAPSGWTKLTDIDDAMIRIVSGAASSGGTRGFSTVFNAGVSNLATHNHGITDPGHRHDYDTFTYQGASGYGGGFPSGVLTDGRVIPTALSYTGIVINNAGSGSVVDFAVKYSDFIRIYKN